MTHESITSTSNAENREVTDEELIARYQASSLRADLEELIKRNLSAVRNLAYRIVLSRSAADDVAQDVFVNVMRAIHSFRSESKVATWLFRITVNTSQSYLRTLGRRREQGYPEMEYTTGNANHQPERISLHTEATEEIERALGQLSTKLRTAIVLTAIEQIPSSEAAQIAGCSTATMRGRIHKARNELKKILSRRSSHE